MKTPNMRRSVVSVAASITAVTHRDRRTRPARPGRSSRTTVARRALGLPRHGATHRPWCRTARGRLPGRPHDDRNHQDRPHRPQWLHRLRRPQRPRTKTPSGVPGIQLDGYFPDTSTFNTTHGWNHDAQFVIRLPRHWNGGLVVAGPPGIRRQYASDVIISDYVLSRGYAYASTDKGNSGPMLYTDGQQPGDVIAEWHSRVTELTVAAKDVLAQRYHREPRRTYVAGFSAAGYLARWQLENRPDLYDGGIAWSGVLMTPERNLLTYLPTALRHYPQYVANGSPEAHQALLDAGFPSWFRAHLGVQLPRVLGQLPADPARGARPHLRRRHACRPSPSALLGPSTATPTTTWRPARPRSERPSRGSRSRAASGSPCCSCREPSTPPSLLVTRASTPP